MWSGNGLRFAKFRGKLNLGMVFSRIVEKGWGSIKRTDEFLESPFIVEL